MRNEREWPRFASWLLVGGGLALGMLSILSIGIFVLPVVAALAVIVGRGSTGSPRALFGLVSGAGLPVLYVAWLNREGPGDVCRAIANGVECTEEWSPWPWLAVGLALLIGGAVAYYASGRRNARASSSGVMKDWRHDGDDPRWQGGGG